MSKQNYSTHRKFYIPHHFVFLPGMLAFTIIGIRNALKNDEQQLEWWMFSVLSFAILFLSIMLRQHYALGNQNRIVRLEFRLRYFELFGKSCRQVEEQLNFTQIAALRFSSDEEFPALLDRAIAENLSGNDIKKSINNWQADEMRV